MISAPEGPTGNKLRIPEKVTVDATEATVKALMVIANMATKMEQTLGYIEDSLFVIAKYHEKKGLIEGTLCNEDLEDGEEEDNGTAA